MPDAVDAYVAELRAKGIDVTVTKVNAGGEKPGAVPAHTAQRKRPQPAGGTWAVILRPACRVVSEANKREHWAAGHRRHKEQREAVGKSWGQLFDECHPFPPLKVTFFHIGPKMDDDNLARAFKAVRDAVAALVGMDDGDPFWTWRYDQRRENRPSKAGVEILIEPRRLT